MTANEVTAAATTTAHETMLAWLIALQPAINLDDTKALPVALMSLVPRTVPEEFEDVFRVGARDSCRRVLALAKTMREKL